MDKEADRCPIVNGSCFFGKTAEEIEKNLELTPPSSFLANRLDKKTNWYKMFLTSSSIGIQKDFFCSIIGWNIDDLVKYPFETISNSFYSALPLGLSLQIPLDLKCSILKKTSGYFLLYFFVIFALRVPNSNGNGTKVLEMWN